MPVQTFEALTDDNGVVRLNGAAQLPAHTKVYVIVPEQTISYAEIAPETADLDLTTIRFPSVRVVDEELAKRLVKTVVGDVHAEL